MKALWNDFSYTTKEGIKGALLILALIALFVIAASAASPVLAAFDRVTGYGI